MKKLIFIAFTLLFSQNIIKAQVADLFMDYNFDDSIQEVPTEFANENEVYLQKNLKTAIFITDKNEVYQYALIHEKLQINSSEAIERNNRVYIPLRSEEGLVVNKLRVILKNGNVILFNEKDILEEVDEERDLTYKYYAINGLEVGCIIEKIFVLKQQADLRGNTIQMQSEIPILKGSFELFHPSFLGFKYKSYNGLPEAVLKENASGSMNSIAVEVQNLKGLSNIERNANWQKHLQSFKYKLYENYDNNNKNLNNYKEFATSIYDNLHEPLHKKTEKAILAYAKNVPVKALQLEQIQEIEKYLKSNIQFNQYFNTNTKLEDVFKTKQANQFEIIKIYLTFFEKFGIKTEMVFTSNRFELTFDPAFESIENLRTVLFYFPEMKVFMEPTAFEFRTPLFDSGFGGNYGLFIKEKEFGGVKMGVGILEIIEIPNEITHDYMNINIDFSTSLEDPKITTQINFGGYAASNFQPLKDFMPTDDYQKILKQIAENYTGGGEINKITTENDGIDLVGKKPFALNIEFSGENFTQKAGSNVLFKIGETIGRQMEFYQEEERALPVEIDYPHYYTRTITVKVPQGLKIQSIDDLKINYVTEIDGEKVAGFKSDATLENNTLVISNQEYYKVLHYPLEHYEAYKKVINAAADFNKTVIVLEKQ